MANSSTCQREKNCSRNSGPLRSMLLTDSACCQSFAVLANSWLNSKVRNILLHERIYVAVHHQQTERLWT